MKKELTIEDMELVKGADSFGLTKEQWREVIEKICRELNEESSK